jgi:hypothetical protein
VSTPSVASGTGGGAGYTIRTCASDALNDASRDAVAEVLADASGRLPVSDVVGVGGGVTVLLSLYVALNDAVAVGGGVTVIEADSDMLKDAVAVGGGVIVTVALLLTVGRTVIDADSAADDVRV